MSKIQMEDFAELGRENVEALVASSMAAAKGFEKLGEHVSGLARKQMEDSQALIKTLSGAKNAKEAFDIQSDFIKSYFDTLLSETGKLSEAAMGVSKEVAEPISARVSATMERMTQAA